jgi:hypothetical protein
MTPKFYGVATFEPEEEEEETKIPPPENPDDENDMPE